VLLSHDPEKGAPSVVNSNPMLIMPQQKREKNANQEHTYRTLKFSPEFKRGL
jgi:hypothetical protein